jgi:hypothetical protein
MWTLEFCAHLNNSPSQNLYNYHILCLGVCLVFITVCVIQVPYDFTTLDDVSNSPWYRKYICRMCSTAILIHNQKLKSVLRPQTPARRNPGSQISKYWSTNFHARAPSLFGMQQ